MTQVPTSMTMSPFVVLSAPESAPSQGVADRLSPVTHRKCVGHSLVASEDQDGVDRVIVVTHQASVDALLILAIRHAATERRQFMEAAKRLTLQIKSIERVNSKSAEPMPQEVVDFLTETLRAHEIALKRSMNGPELRLRKLVRELPVWPAVSRCRGISELGLGLLIAETGDLNRFANPAKVWRRFGLDPGAKQQRGVPSTFSPRRRSVAIMVAEGFIKQGDVYRALYLERKEYESQAHPDLTKAHLHARARRYVAKRFLANLWKQWRFGRNRIDPDGSIARMPTAAASGASAQ